MTAPGVGHDAALTPLPLSLALCDYDRTKPLRDQEVHADGIDLTIVPVTIEESITRMLRGGEFDAAEMSFAAALIAADRRSPDFALLPIFPSRCFRHSAIFVNSGSGIDRPEDLRGKVVGVPFYARLTAAVWARAFLEDDYGVHPSEIDWVVVESLPIGTDDNIPVTLPPDVKVRRVPRDVPLDRRLAAGELDALITARMPQPFRERDSRVRRLFADPRGLEVDYFRRTGIFPPMHVVVVKRELYDDSPWIGPSLVSAFAVAQSLALERAYEIDIARYSLAWWVLDLEAERGVLGPDAWAIGVPPNRKAILALVEHCHRQGLISRRLPLEELFPENVLHLTIE